MIRALLLLLFSASTMAAEDPTIKFAVQPDGSAIVQLTREQVVHCVESGGCFMLTSLEIVMTMALMRERMCSGRQTKGAWQ